MTVARTNCSPQSLFSCATWGEEGEEVFEVEGWGKGVLRLLSLFLTSPVC